MEIHGVYIWPRDQWKSMVGGLSIYEHGINGNPWLGVCLYMVPGSMEIHGLGFVYKSTVWGLSIYGHRINGNPWCWVCLLYAGKSMVWGLSVYVSRIVNSSLEAAFQKRMLPRSNPLPFISRGSLPNRVLPMSNPLLNSYLEAAFLIECFRGSFRFYIHLSRQSS